jgi:hypothetical protein
MHELTLKDGTIQCFEFVAQQIKTRFRNDLLNTTKQQVLDFLSELTQL